MTSYKIREVKPNRTVYCKLCPYSADNIPEGSFVFVIGSRKLCYSHALKEIESGLSFDREKNQRFNRFLSYQERLKRLKEDIAARQEEIENAVVCGNFEREELIQ